MVINSWNNRQFFTYVNCSCVWHCNIIYIKNLENIVKPTEKPRYIDTKRLSEARLKRRRVNVVKRSESVENSRRRYANILQSSPCACKRYQTLSYDNLPSIWDYHILCSASEAVCAPGITSSATDSRHFSFICTLRRTTFLYYMQALEEPGEKKKWH